MRSEMHISKVARFGFLVRFRLAARFFDQMFGNDNVRTLGHRIGIIQALIQKIDTEKSCRAEGFNGRMDFFQMSP
jgi:hypothetical protein